MSPDATCNYVQAGEYNGRDYARRLDGAYFLWYHLSGNWHITNILGDMGDSWWTRFFDTPLGNYTAQGEATGEATVAAGEH